MKLAEALIQRADNKKRIEQLKKRLIENAKVQEGDKPAENPIKILKELEDLLVNQEELINKINQTNVATALGNGTLASQISKRDMLLKKHAILTSFLDAGKIRIERYSKTEIKYETTFDIVKIQKEVDEIAREIRETDTSIQEKNWTVTLV